MARNVKIVQSDMLGFLRYRRVGATELVRTVAQGADCCRRHVVCGTYCTLWRSTQTRARRSLLSSCHAASQYTSTRSFIFSHNKSSLRFSLSRFSWKSQVINSTSCMQFCCTQFQADRALHVDSTDRALFLYTRSRNLTFTGSNFTALTVTENDGEKFIWALDYAIFTKLMRARQLLAKNAYTEFH